MKLCPVCKSDNIESTSSMGLRVIVAIVLLFIPFGIFFCWIPFVLPYNYQCKLCGKESKQDELIEIDWREKEQLLEQEKQKQALMEPYVGKWFVDEQGHYNKIVYSKGLPLLINIDSHKVLHTLRIDSFEIQNDNLTIQADSNIHPNRKAAKFKSNLEHDLTMELTELGSELITMVEFEQSQNLDHSEFLDWLKENKKLTEASINLDIKDE